MKKPSPNPRQRPSRPPTTPRRKPRTPAPVAAAAPSRPAKASERSPVPCMACGHCCTYVAIEVETPTTVRRATELLWYLYHDNMSLYESDDEWMVQLETRCRHLGPTLRCGIYENRPHICRGYSEAQCEVNSADEGRTFYTPEQLLAHLQATRPRLYAKLAKGYMPASVANVDKRAARRLPLLERRFREVRALGVS